MEVIRETSITHTGGKMVEVQTPGGFCGRLELIPAHGHLTIVVDDISDDGVHCRIRITRKELARLLAAVDRQEETGDPGTPSEVTGSI